MERTDPTSESTLGARRSRLPRSLFVAVSVAVVLAGVFSYLLIAHKSQQSPVGQIRASGLPDDVSTSLGNLMELSPVPARPAPAFVLTDQTGHAVSLASFRGHPVVLEFMDSHCVDICPIVSQEFVDAHRDLGTAASVVFVAVNVNPYHASVADVADFSAEHQLDSIPTWHFFTGSAQALSAVWHAYGVDVEAPNPNADIVHSSFVYFIDPHGDERYLANPTDDHTANGTAYLPAGQLTSWGRGIAAVARSLGS